MKDRKEIGKEDKSKSKKLDWVKKRNTEQGKKNVTAK